MAKDKVYDEASTVTAKDGEVVVDGPDHVDVTVTPEAAVETGERLIEGAAHAAGQRRLRDQPHRGQDDR
jgi:hypothetical protein